MKSPSVREAVEKANAGEVKEGEVAVERVVEELASIAVVRAGYSAETAGSKGH